MPNNDNPYIISSQTTASIFAIPASGIAGVAVGLTNAGDQLSDVMTKGALADECLQQVQASIRAFHDEHNRHNVPRTCENQLGDLFFLAAATGDGAASGIESAAITISLPPSHAIQLGLDTSIASSVVGQFVLKQLNPENLHLNASLLGDKDNFMANCRHFMHTFGPEMAALGDKINPYFIDNGGSELSIHQSVVHSIVSTAGHATMGVGATLSIGLDLIGATMREFQLSLTDINQHSEREQKVYIAWSECTQALSFNLKGSTELSGYLFDTANSNINLWLNTLNKVNLLIAALIDLEFWQQSEQETDNNLATGARPSTKLAFLSSIPVVLSLKLVVLSTIAQVESAQALTLKQADLSQITGHAPVLASGFDPLQQNMFSLNIVELTHGFEQVHVALKALLHDLPADDAININHSAFAMHRSTLALSVLPSLMTGLAGLITREIKEGGLLLTKSELPVLQSIGIHRTGENWGDQLDALLTALINTQDAIDKAKDRNVSLPLSLGISRSALFGSICGSLNSSIGILFGLREFRTLTKPAELGELERGQLAAVQADIDKNEPLLLQKLQAANLLSTQKVSRNCAPQPGELISQDQLATAMHRLMQIKQVSRPITHPLDNRHDLNMTGKTIVGTEHATVKSVSINSQGLVEASLGTLSLLALETGLGAQAVVHSLTKACQLSSQVLNNIGSTHEGPDKIAALGTKFNTSSLSNAARLVAGNSNEDSAIIASILEKSVSGSEAIFSRSLTIGLIHHQAFKQGILEFTQLKVQSALSDPSALSLSLADAEIINDLAHVMAEILDGHNQKIPLVNQQAASELAAISQSTITAALSTHSAIILPTITAMRALKAGADGSKDHQEEALGDLTSMQQSLISLNVMRGFTMACINHLQADPDWIAKGNGSLIDTHQVSQRGSEHCAVFIACFSILIEELFETGVSRSLTLLNSHLIKQNTHHIMQVASEELDFNAQAFMVELKEDSRLGKSISVINSPTALRLMLSRMGEFLIESARQIKQEIDLQDNQHLLNRHAMHSAQASTMQSMASALTHCATILSRLTQSLGEATVFPILLRDQVDNLKKSIHGSDQYSFFGPVHSSRNNVSAISLPTALSSDLLVSVISNLFKTLFRASLVGSDVLLSISKVLEILCLHEQPDIALSLQSREVDTINTAKQLPVESLVFSSASLAGLSMVPSDTASSFGDSSQISDSLNSLQRQVDHLIEQLDLLEIKQDEQEAGNEKITLKKYYDQLLQTLNINFEHSREELLDKLNKGGLILASYHGSYKGVCQTDWTVNDDYPQTLRQVHNLQAIRDRFINRIFSDSINQDDYASPQLEAFNQAFRDGAYSMISPSALAEHKYLIESIATKLYSAKNTSRATLFNHRRSAFNREEFVSIYGNPLQKTAPTPVEALPLYTLFASIDSARQTRRQQGLPIAVSLSDNDNIEKNAPVMHS